MNYTVKEIEYLSKNKVDKIHAKIYIPKRVKNIKGILQISHGMCEHIEKYEPFIQFLINNKYIVCGNDHLGHGTHVSNEKKGFFADNNGYKCLIEDLHTLTNIVKNEYENIPYFLLGHSMGSFIARCYMYRYPSLVDGFIIMSTARKNLLVDSGIKLADAIIAKKGKMYRSNLLTDLAMGEFNRKFKPNVSRYDWLNSDEKMLPTYINDKVGNFTFTASGYKDLFYLNKEANNIESIKKLPQNKNILVISGDDDALGEFGTGVLEVYHDLIKTNHPNTSIKLYPKLRHELLNEISKERVYADILNWMNNIIKK